MSGGHFEYQQYRFEDIACEIDRLITKNNRKGNEYPYNNETIRKFKEAAHTIRQAGEMVQRIDWLVCDDDGEDSFHERWKEEVRKYFKS